MKTAPILSSDLSQAVQVLIRLTTTVLDATQQEAGAIARGDGVAFTALQGEKETAIKRYTQASAEFQDRATEFRAADRAELDRLYALQEELHSAAAANNAALIQATERTKTRNITIKEGEQP